MRRGFGGFARAAAGVIVSIVCVWLALRTVDVGESARLVRDANAGWLGLAIGAVCADLTCRALRWQVLMRPIQPVGLRALYGYMLVGYLANNVLPARLGEVIRSHYLGDREGVSRSATLGTVVVERVIDTVVLVAIGAAAILVLQIRGVVASGVLVGTALAALLCVALVVALAAHRLPYTDRVAAFLARWPRFVRVTTSIREGLRVATIPRVVAWATILSVVAWTFTVLAVLATGQAIGVQLTVAQGALLAAGINLATAVPSGPGYIGTFELAGQQIGQAFGLGPASGLALALLVHVVIVATTSLGGTVAFIRLSVSAPHRRPRPAPAASLPSFVAPDS